MRVWCFALALVLGLLSLPLLGYCQAMNTDEFWTLIDRAHASAGSNREARVSALRDELRHLSPAELQQFQNHYDVHLKQANRWDVWAAAEIMYSWVGASDDSFRYFRDWLISEGRTRFEATLANPDSLAELARTDMPELEAFGYVALGLFKQKASSELNRDFSTEGVEPTGMRWKRSDLPVLLPRLWAKY
jgi:Protein of unknown function (DUF4240)